jgi:hypothetical protein
MTEFYSSAKILRSVAKTALVALGLLSATAASANVAYTYSLQSVPAPGGIVVDDFDGTNAANEKSYWLPSDATGCAVSNTTANCNSAIGNPPIIGGTGDTGGAPPGVTGNWLAVSNGPDGQSGVGFFQINISAIGTNNVSFYWGSVDQWNFVQLLDAQGNALDTVHGTDLGSTFDNGIPISVGSAEFTFTWDSTDPVTTIQFGDAFGPAFELADVTTQVPEPNGLAIMLAGLSALGLAGLAGRRALSA